MDAAQRWARTEGLFDAVFDLGQAARAAYLARECADPQQRAEVGELLGRGGMGEVYFAHRDSRPFDIYWGNVLVLL